MNPALRKLAQGPHGDLAGQAYPFSPALNTRLRAV